MSEPNLELEGPSEAEWHALVHEVSAGNTRYFTENQLYCRYARGRVVVTRYISRRGKLGLILVAVGLLIWVYGLKKDWGLSLVLGIATTLTGVAQVGTGVVTRRDPAPREPVTRWLEKQQTEAPLPTFLATPTLAQRGAELRPTRVECLILVEHDLLAELLLKNGVHEALSALVVSERGYPEALAREAQRVLDERSDLKVLAVHDATEHGVASKARWARSPVLSLTEHAIIDAGLFAADVGQLEELARAFPASAFTQVPLDALSLPTLLAGLSGVTRGAFSLSAGIHGEVPPSADAAA